MHCTGRHFRCAPLPPVSLVVNSQFKKEIAVHLPLKKPIVKSFIDADNKTIGKEVDHQFTLLISAINHSNAEAWCIIVRLFNLGQCNKQFFMIQFVEYVA